MLWLNEYPSLEVSCSKARLGARLGLKGWTPHPPSHNHLNQWHLFCIIFGRSRGTASLYEVGRLTGNPGSATDYVFSRRSLIVNSRQSDVGSSRDGDGGTAGLGQRESGGRGRVSCLPHYLVSLHNQCPRVSPIQVPWYSFVNQLNSHCCPIIFDGSTVVSSSHVSFENKKTTLKYRVIGT